MQPKQPSKQHSALMAGFIGNIVEWYDFALYGYMASYISTLFFPGDDRLVSLLATYGVFAAGFIMRPLGSAFFGWLGDSFGRTRAMMISVIMMAFPTFLIGILPTHEQAGLLAPLLLVLIRLVQGLSVGGEFSSSVTYLVETAPKDQRGFSASFANLGSIAGMLLGSGVASLLTSLTSEETILAWAWRLPFLVGAIIGISAILIRRDLRSSSHFQRHDNQRTKSSPLKEAFTVSLGQTVKAMLFASAYGAIFYMALVYLPNWASEQAGIELDQAMRINTMATIGLLFIIPLSGWLSDRYITRVRLVSLAMLGIIATAIPLSEWMMEGSFVALLIMQSLLVLLLGLPLGAAPAMFAEMFPTRDRLSGYSVAYNLGLGVVGGATPMMATGLIKITGIKVAPSWLLLVAATLGVGTLLWVQDRSRDELQ